MNKSKKIFNKYVFWILPYLIVFLVIIILYIIMGIYPFGNQHILQIDAYQAYAPRVNELYSKLREGESLFYSWQGGLGNDFYLSFVTSMFQPILLVGIFFKTQNITEVFSLFYLIQIPVCAATCSIFLKEAFKKFNIITICFSVMYALCAFVTASMFVYYWIMGVAMLPLVALGLEKLINDRKILLYVISLGIGIISNYMIGFFLCFFSVLYYIYLISSKNKSIKTELKRNIWIFIKASLLAGGISCIATIPAIISLNYTTYGGTREINFLKISSYFSFTKFITANYFGMTPSVLQGGTGLPNIYSGLLSYILLPFYFINNKIPRKEKICNGFNLIILYLFFNINILDYIIHGLHYPSGIPHRFAFVYVFIVLGITYKAFLRLEDISWSQVGKIYIGIFTISMILFSVYPIKRVEKPGVFTEIAVILNTLIIITYFIIICILKRNKKKYITQIITYSLALIIIIELGVNTYKNFNLYAESTNRDKYVNFLLSDINSIKEEIEEDREFCRMEQYPDRVISDGKLFQYNGISMFSICYTATQQFLKKLGVNSSTNKIEYRLSTPFLNSIFGVKYSLNRDFLYDLAPTYFKEYSKNKTVALYKNPYALPIAFMVDEQILKTNYKEEESGFEYQNEIIKGMTGKNSILFEKEIKGNIYLEELLEIEKVKNNKYTYKVQEDIQPGEIPSVTIEFDIKKSGYYYMELNSKDVQNYSVILSGKENIRRDTLNIGCDTMDIGYLEEGSKFQIKLNIKNELDKKDKEDLIKENNNIWNAFFEIIKRKKESYIQTGDFKISIVRLNDTTFLESYNILSSQSLLVNEYNDTMIKGTITVDNPGIMYTSIPYDKRWKCYVDGKQVESKCILNALLAIPLQEGKHDIILQFKPKGIVLSIIISCFCLFILLLEFKKEIIQYKKKGYPKEQ